MRCLFLHFLLFLSTAGFCQTSVSEIVTLGGKNRIIYDLDIDEDAGRLVASLGNSLEVWDYNNKTLLKSWTVEKVISLDIQQNLVAAGSKGGSLYVWDMEGNIKSNLKISSTPLIDVKWIENGILICGTEAGEVVKVDSEKNGTIGSIKMNTSVTSIGVIANRNLIIAGDADGSLHFIDLEKMQELRSQRGHKSWVREICVLPGEKNLFFSAGDDGRLVTWYSNSFEFEIDSKSFSSVFCLDIAQTKDSKMLIATGYEAGHCKVSLGSSEYKLKLNVMINNIFFLKNDIPKITLIVGTHGKGIMIIPGTKMNLEAPKSAGISPR